MATPAKAAAEVAAKPVTIKFLGLKLTGPPTLPATFSLDAAALAGGDEGALHRILVSVLGDGQMAAVRGALTGQDSDDGGATLLGELIESITGAYGLSEGE